MAKHIEQFRPSTLKVATPQSRKADVKWYQSPRWRALARLYRQRHPLCEDCKKALSQQVHHKKPRKDYPELAFEWSNLEAVCIPCHLKKEER